MQIGIVNASRLDFDRHLLLLRKSFEQSAWAAQIGTTLTREFYLWKYFSPAGEAIISNALIEGDVASSVTAVPTLLQTPCGIRKGWQVGDIATLPLARRRGYYRSCLRALVELLGDEILVCFPNDNSTKEIRSQGFRFATDVRTFVRPLNPFAVRLGTIKRENNLTPFREFHSVDVDGSYSFFKNRDHLEWRYRKNPACRYYIIQTDEGYCVFRPFKLFGSAVSIVMEVAAASERVVGDLIRESERIAAGSRMRANFIMTSSPSPLGLHRRYLPLPQMLLPKRQALFVRAPSAMIPSTKWNVQIGDWDGL